MKREKALQAAEMPPPGLPKQAGRKEAGTPVESLRGNNRPGTLHVSGAILLLWPFAGHHWRVGCLERRGRGGGQAPALRVRLARLGFARTLFA